MHCLGYVLISSERIFYTVLLRWHRHNLNEWNTSKHLHCDKQNGVMKQISQNDSQELNPLSLWLFIYIYITPRYISFRKFGLYFFYRLLTKLIVLHEAEMTPSQRVPRNRNYFSYSWFTRHMAAQMLVGEDNKEVAAVLGCFFNGNFKSVMRQWFFIPRRLLKNQPVINSVYFWVFVAAINLNVLSYCYSSISTISPFN